MVGWSVALAERSHREVPTEAAETASLGFQRCKRMRVERRQADVRSISDTG
jgi:hypothetical protein